MTISSSQFRCCHQRTRYILHLVTTTTTTAIIHLFFHIFLIFPNTCCCFPDANSDVLFATAIMQYVATKVAEVIDFLDV